MRAALQTPAGLLLNLICSKIALFLQVPWGLNLGENLSNSFEYAKKLFSDGARLIILIILSFIPVVDWIVVGYATRVLKTSPGTDTPPPLEKYGDMFVDGAKVFFVTLLYMLIPFIIIGMGVASFFTTRVFEGELTTPTTIFSGTSLVLLLIGVVLAFLALIILGAATAHMINTGKFGKAFALGEVLGVIRGIGWGRYLGWVLLVAVIGSLVGLVVGVIPFVGWLVQAIIAPALIVFFFRSLGLLYNEGASQELRVPLTVPPPPTSAAAETKFCINCGTQIPVAASFCTNCGAEQA